MEFLIGLVVGAVVTGVIFIVFGKNNQNKIAQARADVLAAYGKGETELKSLIESWKK